MNDIKLYEDSKNEIITSEKTEKRKTFNEIYFQQKEEIQKLLSNFIGNISLDDEKSNIYVEFENKISALSDREKIKLIKKFTPTSSNYSVGFIILPAIKYKLGKRNNINAFIKWAEMALQKRNDRYNLPQDESEQMNDVIQSYIGCNNFEIKNFNKLSSILQKTGSERMLVTYKLLLQKAVEDAKKKADNVPFKYRKNELAYKKELYKKFENKFTQCINDIDQFLKNQIEKKSYTWYLEMDAGDLQNIFSIAEEIKEPETSTSVLLSCQNEINSFLNRLLSYYVETTRRILEKDENINTDIKWNLNDLFDLIAARTSNQNLKRQILKEYFDNNKNQNNFPLPLKLIKDSLFNQNSNADISFKKDLLDLLNLKYKKNPSHEIEDNIKELIADDNASIELRLYALKLGIVTINEISECLLFLGSDSVDDIKETEIYIDKLLAEKNNNPNVFQENIHRIVEALSADKIPQEARKYIFEILLRA